MKSKDQCLGGKDIILELDESKFGRRKYHKGLWIDGILVFGVVERTIYRKIVLFPVPNRSSLLLNKLIFKFANKDTIIYSVL